MIREAQLRRNGELISETAKRTGAGFLLVQKAFSDLYPVLFPYLTGTEAKAAGKSVGLRINPECSTQEGHDIHDPCASGSRLGITRQQWDVTMTDE